MTVIELLDRSPIQNILSCLMLKPRRVIFLGVYPDCAEKLKKYRKFLEDKKIDDIELDYEQIDINDLQNIENALTQLIEKEENCVFDLTGGEEPVLVAAGMVYEKFRNKKNIKFQQFDEISGKAFYNGGEDFVTCAENKLTIEDFITLYEGKIISKELSKEYIDEEFTSLLDEIWRLSKKKPVEWNTMTGAMYAFEKHKLKNGQPLNVVLNLNSCKTLVKDYESKKRYLLKILQILSAMKIITGLHIKPESITYTYKSEKVRKCLAKSGNVLEIKVLSEAAKVKDLNGEPYFSDMCTGVFIEWDPTGHFSAKNEIDVMLMHGLIPIFISCKNGAVKEDELYKLNSVAEEFGGENVRKVLVISDKNATDLNEDSLKFFKERARSMGVRLIENARNLTQEKWQEEFLNII